MRRATLMILLLIVVPASASAQTPIPQGPSGDAPRMVGGPASAQPVQAPPLAPQHPSLAPNGRSNIHDDAYMTDVYAGGGPLGRATQVSSVFEGRECASVTFDARGRIVTVCVGLDRPVLALKDPVTLATLASYDLPPRRPSPTANLFGDFTGGGYFFLDDRDRAVVPTTTRHVLVIGETAAPGFAVQRDIDLSGVLADDDKIVSVLPDWSGRLWFITEAGVVGTVARDADVVRLHPTGERISNSFATDEDGGVYIVTDGALYRFDAALDGTPQVSWRTAYANAGVKKPGQTQAGSGTTPTLMHGGLVAITDNADPMNVVVLRRGRGPSGGGREVCRAPVFARGAGATDNSLVAAGGSIVVENNFGYTGPAATENGRTTAPGIERIDVDADAGTCRRVWHSDERSPTVVPKLSLANGLVYAYTKDPPASGDADLWYLTALDFRTGRTRFKVLAGEGLGFNNNYAPVSLGPDESAYVGVLGGLTRFADRTAPDPDAPGTGDGMVGPAVACFGRRARFGKRTLAGAVRLGESRTSIEDRFGATGAKAVRLCARGGSVRVAFDGRGRARFIASTAKGHTLRGVPPGMRASSLRRRVRTTAVSRVVRRRGRAVFGVRRGRVRWVAIVSPRASDRVVLRSARAAGLRVR